MLRPQCRKLHQGPPNADRKTRRHVRSCCGRAWKHLTYLCRSRADLFFLAFPFVFCSCESSRSLLERTSRAPSEFLVQQLVPKYETSRALSENDICQPSQLRRLRWAHALLIVYDTLVFTSLRCRRSASVSIELSHDFNSAENAHNAQRPADARGGLVYFPAHSPPGELSSSSPRSAKVAEEAAREHRRLRAPRRGFAEESAAAAPGRGGGGDRRRAEDGSVYTQLQTELYPHMNFF